MFPVITFGKQIFTIMNTGVGHIPVHQFSIYLINLTLGLETVLLSIRSMNYCYFLFPVTMSDVSQGVRSCKYHISVFLFSVHDKTSQVCDMLCLTNTGD